MRISITPSIGLVGVPVVVHVPVGTQMQVCLAGVTALSGGTNC